MGQQGHIQTILKCGDRDDGYGVACLDFFSQSEQIMIRYIWSWMTGHSKIIPDIDE